MVQRRALAEFDAARIRPLRPIEIARQRDVRMPGVVGAADDVRRAAAAALSPARPRRRQAPQRTSWRRSPAAAAPDRRADRDGCRPARRSGRRSPGDPRRVAHTAPRPCRAGAGTRIRFRRSASSRMVATVSALWVANCGKMPRPQRQQFSRAGDVVQIGHRLAGEHRIAVEAALLRALDLGVPIGALHQPHHHPPVQAARELVDIVDHRRSRASDRPGSPAQSHPSPRAMDRRTRRRSRRATIPAGRLPRHRR